MDITKDYYAILGLVPSAEETVIRAAYKALAHRYHPDRNQSHAAEAGRKMAELNEARDALLDPIKRKQYDQARGANTKDSDGYLEDEQTDPPPEYDPLEEDWRLIVKYYPDLVALEASCHIPADCKASC